MQKMLLYVTECILNNINTTLLAYKAVKRNSLQQQLWKLYVSLRKHNNIRGRNSLYRFVQLLRYAEQAEDV